jgi:hypothetical protein
MKVVSDNWDASQPASAGCGVYGVKFEIMEK